MKNKKIISNLLFIIAIVFSTYTLIKVYLSRSNIPEGVCPINEYNNYIYISIGLLLFSFVISFIVDKNDNKK